MKYYQVLKDLVDLQDKYELDAYNYQEVEDRLVLIAEEVVLVDEVTKLINTLDSKLELLKREKLKSPFKLKLVVDKENYKEYLWNDCNCTYKVTVTDEIEITSKAYYWEEKYRNLNYYDIKLVKDKVILEALIDHFNSEINLDGYMHEEEKVNHYRNIKMLEGILLELEYKEIRE